MSDQGSPATPRMLVCDECNANGCPPHYGDEDCKPGCVHPNCRAREIAAGLAEIGTGGTPAFIRGYNAGWDDAWEARAEDAAAPGLREALESLPPATCYRTHTQPDEGKGIFGAVWLADVRRALAAAPAAAAGARLRNALRKTGWWPDLDAEDYATLARQLSECLAATTDTPEAAE